MRRAPQDSGNARRGDNGALVVVWLASVQTLGGCLLRLVAPLTMRACHSAFLRATPPPTRAPVWRSFTYYLSNLPLGRLSRNQVIGPSRPRRVRAALVLGGNAFTGAI